jgi:hypothetical protein
MTKDNAALSALDLLEVTLETYGADRTRWPAQRRRELSHIIASSAEAQKRLDDAAVFDRLLDQAPVLSSSRQAALIDKIMAGVETAPRLAVAPSKVPPARSPRWRPFSAAGAALAASLMLGIIAGQNGTFSTTADDIAAAAGLNNSASQQMAQTDDGGGLFDEDLL